MRILFAIAFACVFVTAADAGTTKKHTDANGNVVRRCDPPKRWVEVDSLADDAGRPSKVICK